MAEITWAPSALKDIKSIAEYIERDSLQAACNMVELFFEKATILEKYPLLGKPVPELKVKYLREILVSRYRIIYEVYSEDEVYILSVHHQSRLLKNNPTFKRRMRK
jgi:addiction module RelE/StbE family toxin